MNEYEYEALTECCHLSEKFLISPGIAVYHIRIFKAKKYKYFSNKSVYTLKTTNRAQSCCKV